MSKRLRVVLALMSAGVLGGAFLLFAPTHASAKGGMSYSRLSKIQKRIVSETLASALGPVKSSPGFAPGNDDEGGGPDGAPFTPPSSFGAPGGGPGALNTYYPTDKDACAVNRGNNVKVNQNCLNITDPDLQGRGQANNEPAIAVNPFDDKQVVASDNSYVRGDGTCGAYFSSDNGHTWNNATTPNSFTRGPSGFARQYWQAGGDTDVAWDTRGNAYLSCQLFNRGNAASPNPDESSTFVMFRSTQNGGASFNFPGRYSTPPQFDPDATSGVLIDKALMAIDDNLSSPYRDRIYVTWTQFAADGTAYIYEVHSADYGETFSAPVVVSTSNPTCTNTFGAPTPHGTCNENQFSDPFVGPDGSLYVVWNNFNNQATSGTDNKYQVLLAKSTDGGQTFGPTVQVSPYYDLPDCDTYQGDGADPGRSCVPEKGSSTVSDFRATNYPSGAVDPQKPNVVAVTFGSYINQASKESNGCAPTGFADSGNPTYTGVKTAGACSNKILLSVSTNGGSTFTGTGGDPRTETLVPQAPGQAHTDQYWQWTQFTSGEKLAVDYYDRQYGNDETTGASDFSVSGSKSLTKFGQARVTSSSLPAPTEFGGAEGGQFYGDYVGLSTSGGKAYAIWSDTRAPDLFVCPGTATPGTPPALCTGTEPNGLQANDEDTYMAQVGVPNG